MGRCIRHVFAPTLAAVALLQWLSASSATRAQSPVECVLRVELSGVVTPGMAGFLVSSVEEANERSCALLVVIDTPGGMVDATREIVRAFLGSSMPVITFVGEEGARAASAGALITMAGHVAAMAPSAHLGAAHPVALGGEQPSEVMNEKLVSDVAAFARAIAERRERDPAVAERMVRESVALTAAEAVTQRVVDLEVASESALLDALDGRTVVTVSGPVVLALGDAEVVPYEMELRERIVHRLGDPNLAYVLMMVGMLAIFFELTTPGIGAAGAVGLLALLLAFIGLSRLPIDAGGIALMVLGVVLIVAELFVVSYGLLALSGVGCLTLGALLLIDVGDPDFWVAPDIAVSWELLVPLSITVGLGVLLLSRRALKAARTPSTTGSEALVGQAGQATQSVGPNGGEVSVLGERWTAFAEEPIDVGAKVRVVGVDGLSLKVEPMHCARERTTGGNA